MTQAHKERHGQTVEPGPAPRADGVAPPDDDAVGYALPPPMSFGAAFRTWLQEVDQADLLEHRFCGWLDDGCAVLALGIERWLGACVTLYALCEGDLVQHVVARVGERWYLDAAGLWDTRGLLDRWERDNGVHGPRLVALSETLETSWTASDNGFRLQPASGEPLRASWLVTNDDLVERLAERLGRRWNAATVRDLLAGRPTGDGRAMP
jgi:hypothetical protein